MKKIIKYASVIIFMLLSVFVEAQKPGKVDLKKKQSELIAALIKNGVKKEVAVKYADNLSATSASALQNVPPPTPAINISTSCNNNTGWEQYRINGMGLFQDFSYSLAIGNASPASLTFGNLPTFMSGYNFVCTPGLVWGQLLNLSNCNIPPVQSTFPMVFELGFDPLAYGDNIPNTGRLIRKTFHVDVPNCIFKYQYACLSGGCSSFFLARVLNQSNIEVQRKLGTQSFPTVYPTPVNCTNLYDPVSPPFPPGPMANSQKTFTIESFDLTAYYNQDVTIEFVNSPCQSGQHLHYSAVGGFCYCQCNAIAQAGPDVTVCSGNATTIGSAAITGNAYSWTSSPAGFTSSLANPGVSPTVTTTYFLSVTNLATQCSAKDTAVVTVNNCNPVSCCNPWPNTINYTTTLTGTGAPTGSGVIANNGTLFFNHNYYLNFPNLSAPCTNAAGCTGTLTYSLYAPDNTPVAGFINESFFNSGTLWEQPCSDAGKYKIVIKAKCGTDQCNDFTVYIDKPCPPVGACEGPTGYNITYRYNLPTGSPATAYKIKVQLFQNGIAVPCTSPNLEFSPSGYTGSHLFYFSPLDCPALISGCIDYKIIIEKTTTAGTAIIETIGDYGNNGLIAGMNNDLCCGTPPCLPNCSFTGQLWGTGIPAAGMIMRCKDTINVQCNTMYQGGISLTCTNPASTTLLTTGEIRNAAGQIVTGLPFSNYNFPNAGFYTYTYYKTDPATNLKCDSCKITFKVTCKDCQSNCTFTGTISGLTGPGSNTNIQCDSTYTLHCKKTYQGGVSLNCTTPTSSNLLTGVFRNQLGQVVAPLWSGGYFSFPNAGTYTATYYKTNAAGLNCDSCRITFKVVCCNIHISGTPLCSSNDTNTNGVDITVTGGTAPYTYLWSNTPSPQTTEDLTMVMPGSYWVSVTDANGCEKTEVFKIICPPAPCNCANIPLAKTAYNIGNATWTYFPTGGQINAECNKLYNFWSSINNLPANCNNVTIDAELKDGATQIAFQANVSATNPLPYTFTAPGAHTYSLIFDIKLNGVSCKKYILIVNTNCTTAPVDCCKGGYWEKIPVLYSELDDKVLFKLDCKTPDQLVISSSINSKYCSSDLTIDPGNYVCGDKNCKSKIVYTLSDNNSSYVLTGTGNMNIPGTLPNGNYTLKMEIYCGGKLCDKCEFPIIKNCQPACDCKKAQCTFKTFYLEPNGTKKQFKCNASLQLECNKTYPFVMSVDCQNNCPYNVTAELINTTTGGIVIPQTSVSVTNPFNVTFNTPGTNNYSIMYRLFVDGKECDQCKVNITVTCPPPVCKPCDATISNTTQISLTTNTSLGVSQLTQSFTFTGLPSSVTEVRAVITNVSITATDEQGNKNEECLSCINNPLAWGSIVNGNSIATITPKIYLNGGYVNPPIPVFVLTDKNPREIIWTNPGNTFFVNGPIKIDFLLPQASTLKCCTRKATICVKFVFRDNNCTECIVYKCFDAEIK